MAIFMNIGPAAVMYPLGAIDSSTDDMDMSDTNKVDASAAAAAATAGASAATAAAAAATSTAPQQESRAAHTSCRRLSSTDARPIFTNPSHKRSRDAGDDEFAPQIEPRSSNSNLSLSATSASASALTNDSNAPVIPRCKKVEVDHDAGHHGHNPHNPFTSTNATATASTPATVTEPLIARDGWPTESPHFTEERITFALGVGWRYLPVRPGDIGGDLDFVAAMRGWERFIENHFRPHIGRARIFLERKDEGMYLVAATPPSAKSAAERAQAQRVMTTRYDERGEKQKQKHAQAHPAFFEAMEEGDDEVAYYLFKNDLSRARCVGGSWGQCVENLNKRPICFLAGSVELVAQQPPPETQKVGSADGDDMDIDVSN